MEIHENLMKNSFFDGNLVVHVTRVITLIDFLKGTRQKGTDLYKN